MVLMRSFVMLYITLGMSQTAERQAFTLLASVCSYWRLALTGWPHSPTGHWVRHKLRKLIQRECFVFNVDMPGQLDLRVVAAICTCA